MIKLFLYGYLFYWLLQNHLISNLNNRYTTLLFAFNFVILFIYLFFCNKYYFSIFLKINSVTYHPRWSSSSTTSCRWQRLIMKHGENIHHKSQWVHAQNRQEYALRVSGRDMINMDHTKEKNNRLGVGNLDEYIINSIYIHYINNYGRP